MTEPTRYTCEGVSPLAITAAQEIINVNLALRGAHIAMGAIDGAGNLSDLEFGDLNEADMLHDAMATQVTEEQEACGLIVAEPTDEQLMQRRGHLLKLLDMELK
ncbi:MAG: hypothetical protein ABIR37_04015 [Candidatus Saccharimonadales bacterium]